MTAGSASVRHAGESFVRSRAFEVLSRAGFISRGLVWGIIGILAFKLAVGHGGKTTNQQGALHTVAQQPFGKILLTLVAIGLGGYSLWRLVRAAIGHGPEASDAAFERVAGAASGIGYAVTCTIAVKILTGAGAGNTGNTKHETGGILGWPAGNWIVGIAGAVMIGTALYQGYRGITKDFFKDSKVEQMGRQVSCGSAGRDDRPSRSNGDLRAHRDLPRQGCDQRQPAHRDRTRRRSRQARPSHVRPVVSRPRCRRPDRLRALLDERRALPQDLTQPSTTRP